ncbi:MAG: very short patch repair endonuclease [Candidatus Binatia bacterium]
MSNISISGKERRDFLTQEQRSKRMAKVRSRDTSPEMIVRRLAHRMHYRYRLHRHDLPGKPDLVFPGRRKVVFVHGCFWHGHNCSAGLNRPKTNKSYWVPKLERNRERDAENQARLRKLGWQVLVIWECDLRDQDRLKRLLGSFLESRWTPRRRLPGRW